MTLKFYNVWKLHRPRMSHGLLADDVDRTLASYTTDAVFSEMRDHGASWVRRALLTRCLSAVAELFVCSVAIAYHIIHEYMTLPKFITHLLKLHIGPIEAVYCRMQITTTRRAASPHPSMLSSWHMREVDLRSSAVSSIWTQTPSTPSSLSTRSTRASTEYLPAGASRLTSLIMRTAVPGGVWKFTFVYSLLMKIKFSCNSNF